MTRQRETPEEYERKKMEEHKKNLKKVLRELFQIEDAAELDHGMYRIMKLRRAQVEEFINNGLIEEVDAVFGEYTAQQWENAERDKQTLEEEIRSTLGNEALAKDSIREDLLTTPIAQKLNERYLAVCDRLKAGNMSDQHKGEVFSRIADFFSRYYDDGDFMSLRHYSAEGKYAIPYNGEEVLLHWANKDQYYIKTERYLKNYGFEVGENTTVRFEVVTAESTKNNNKTEKRHLVLAPETEANDEGEAIIPIGWKEDARELTIRFQFITLDGASLEEYREFIPRGAQRENPNRDDVIKGVVTKILEQVPDADLKVSLSGQDDTQSLLEKHITRFSSEHTSDYFIHKNLRKFLTQELDFYIKNEVFRLDDLATGDERQMQQYIDRARVLKRICLRIIDFLAHMEEFQKKLWEKKKFVLSSNYSMTLDHIPEKYYPEICANKKQMEDWEKLYSIGNAEQRTFNNSTVEFLNSKPYLTLDTAFFDAPFKDRLLKDLQHPDGTPIEDLDEAIGGLMVKSENWQAMHLLQERYEERVTCVYIDPPFNTDATQILYRNGYRHSTWLTLMQNAIIKSRIFLEQDGMFFSAIDDFELNPYCMLADSVFGPENKQGILVVEINASGRSNDQFLATSHEYYLCYSQDPTDISINFSELSDEQKAEYSLNDDIGPYKWRDFLRTGGYSTPEERPNSFYPIYFSTDGKISLSRKREDDYEIWPIDSEGQRRVWRKIRTSFSKHLARGDIKVDRGRGDVLKVYIKDRIKDGTRPKSVWIGSKFDASTHGTKLLKKYFNQKKVFDFPKSLHAVQSVLSLMDSENNVILDFFAGSGTTAHAVLNLNREDGENRKYILVEMGDSFYTVTKPRIQKVMYSDKWKNGKPEPAGTGQSHIFKYIELEQYEDTLDNIVLEQRTLDQFDDYLLHYMLDVESRDSMCRVNVDAFRNPFEYKLRIRRADGKGHEDRTVDLADTFSYLLGLRVKRLVPFDNEATCTHYLVVHGTLPSEQSTTIIWRKCTSDEVFLKADKAFIEEHVLAEYPADVVYVNGYCFVDRARPIEKKFKDLMGA